jgi:phosphatidylserine/phosphatidylglycerophosphate/cardiolipin synthase-like enzyme
VLITPPGILYHLLALLGRPFRGRSQGPLREPPPPAPAGAWWADDSRWATGDLDPREGNVLTPLIDGEHAMRAMHDAVAAAQVSVHLCAWFTSPPLLMVRDEQTDDQRTPHVRLPWKHWRPAPTDAPAPPPALRGLLARKAAEVDVRVLLWPGSVVGKFQKRRVRAVQRVLACSHPRLRCRLDKHERPTHCHHQKALVVDGRIAFVGGLDITDFDADRWDTQWHRWRTGLNWHDCHMQIEGPAAADVERNFVQRWNALAPHDPVPDPIPVPPIDAGAPAQILRTLPRGIYPFARRGVYTIFHAYAAAIARAERFIYIENQYLWSPEITTLLCEAIARPRRTPFQVALVLPAHPNAGKSDTDVHLRRLLAADEGRGVLGLYTLYTWTRVANRGTMAYQPIYVHAKVAVIDDTWCTVGSANLNGRGMASDTEMNVATTDAQVARRLRLGLWAEHLACAESELAGADALDVLRGRWRTAAEENGARLVARREELPYALMPYPMGEVIADWGWGELEAGLLDR